MFSIFKRNKETDFELTTNPAILFNKNALPESLSLFQIKLGDDYSKINMTGVTHTTMEQLPKNATSGIWRDGKSFYKINDEEIEYLLVDRIDSVVENDGWFHMDSGIKYRIKNKKVVEFAIHGQLLTFYTKLSKGQIERKFGRADKVKETIENYDGTLFRTDFIYFKRQIRIHYDDWDKVIDLINIGETLIDYK